MFIPICRYAAHYLAKFLLICRKPDMAGASHLCRNLLLRFLRSEQCSVGVWSSSSVAWKVRPLFLSEEDLRRRPTIPWLALILGVYGMIRPLLFSEKVKISLFSCLCVHLVVPVSLHENGHRPHRLWYNWMLRTEMIRSICNLQIWMEGIFREFAVQKIISIQVYMYPHVDDELRRWSKFIVRNN